MHKRISELLSRIPSWHILSSNYLVQDRWFTLRADRCQVDRERSVDPYFVVETKDSVHMVVVDEQGRVLLTGQYRHGAQIKSLEFPCGEIDPGETPEAAMHRELREETGCTPHLSRGALLH